MACQKIRNKQEAAQYLGKRCIIYFQTTDLYTFKPFTASITGIVHAVGVGHLSLNWGSPIMYADIKRIIVSEPSSLPVKEVVQV